MAEFLDVRNPDGTVTGETVEKKLAHATGVLHGASHIWIWRVKDGKLEIMLQHRAPTKSSFPDCFDISAAGHLTAGESYFEGAQRELFEELGVKATEEELIFFGWLKEDIKAEFFGKPYYNREVSALYLYETDLDEGAFTLQTEEVSEVKWMDAESIIPNAKAGVFEHCLRFDEVERAIEAAKAELAKR